MATISLCKKTLSPVRLVLMVTIYLFLNCTGVFLCIWGEFTIAKDRPKWRQQTHSKPKPPDARWLMGNLRVNGNNFFMQKDTQPSQTCSEGHTSPVTVLYRCVSLYLRSTNQTRLDGCPQMTWGKMLENTLASKGISKEFTEWIAIAKDRPKWRQQTQTKSKPPDA